MIDTINGGADDLVQWSLDIDNGMEAIRVYGDTRPQYVQARPVEATLTLHGVGKSECEAIIALVNDIRSRSLSISEPPVRPGSRFSGLEFE
jgi:hypothetical protein